MFFVILNCYATSLPVISFILVELLPTLPFVVVVGRAVEKLLACEIQLLPPKSLP